MKALLFPCFLLLLVSQAIGAELSFSPNRNITICGPTTVYFVYNKIVDPDLIYWDFGDGITSTKINPEHYYEKDGVYDVKLVVIKNNIRDSLVKKGMITIKPNPYADFNKKMISQTNPGKGVDFLLTNTSTHFATGFEKVRWLIAQDTLWGDTVLYTFKRDGEYTITLLVQNDAGCFAEKTAKVSINNSGVDFPTGITEEVNERFSMYPNPANDLLYLNIKGVEGQVILFNSLGEIQPTSVVTLAEGMLALGTASLPPGMYWVSITTNQQILRKPLRINH